MKVNTFIFLTKNNILLYIQLIINNSIIISWTNSFQIRQARHVQVIESYADEICYFSKDFRRHVFHRFYRNFFWAKLCVFEILKLVTQFLNKFANFCCNVL